MYFHCPYCQRKTVPAPPDIPRPHAECNFCNAKPRAVITNTQSGEKLIKYVKDGRHPTGQALVLRSVRITRKQAARWGRGLSAAVRRGLDTLEKDGER